MMTKALIGTFSLLLVAMQYEIWLNHNGMPLVHSLQSTLQQRITANQQLIDRNQQLTAEIIDLKQNHQAIEERARRDLGMIQRGETFYKLVQRENLS